MLTPKQNLVELAKQMPALSPRQERLFAAIDFTYVRGVYLPVHVALREPNIKHVLSAELSPSCHILPITNLAENKLSSIADLVAWCNNLARAVGVFNPKISGYEIQHYTLCDGWVNTWTDDKEHPITFSSEAEAKSALADFLSEAEGYDPSEFRIKALNNPNGTIYNCTPKNFGR